MRGNFRWVLVTLLLTVASSLRAAAVSIEGAPSDSGYNVGTVATVRATLRGVTGDPSRYAVFADIQYLGTTAVASVELDRKGQGNAGELHYEGDWPIPSDAPTGIYGVTLRVEDRASRREVTRKEVRGFAGYKKLLRIARVKLDKTFYSVGEPIQCEVALENLADHDLKDLRVEFSNANYPWISSFSETPNPAQTGQPTLSSEAPLILSDTRGVDFGPYLSRIVFVVRRNWYAVIPESARQGERGRTTVVLEILKDGSVPQVRLIGSSGSNSEDQAAIAGIQASAPFPPLPVEFRGKHLVLQLSFLYNQGPIPKSQNEAQNPDLALRVLRDHLNLPAHGEVTIPMTRAGTATFLQGTLVTLLGAGGPARHAETPPPEVDSYTLAVWNGDRTELYDMQFSPQAIIRPLDRDLPKPYSNLSYTHRYNADIDFTKYREFYPPGEISPVIALSRATTLFRPGDSIPVKATLKNSGEGWKGLELRAQVLDSTGKELHQATLLSGFDLAPGESRSVDAKAWNLPDSFPPGNYRMFLTLVGNEGRRMGQTTQEIAVNKLPASLLVFVPHEDDEHAYAGLIRAALEAGIPVRVVVFTGGDVGECERYYSAPCGPNEAREFGMVRMEETREALEHLGLSRDKVSILGLPDGGSGEIWFHHVKLSNPFLSVYLATDHAPYDDVLKPNLLFARDAVVDLVKQVITEFKPAMIATAHPDERHVDHRTANWFVIKACQELLHETKMDPNTLVLADQAYGAGGYKPAPFHYQEWPVYLSGEAAALKQEMSWIYQSQDGNIDEGMKKTWGELPPQEIHYRILDWQEHEGWNE